jgi:hypothetical protein
MDRIEWEYSKEELETLRYCYESPTNEYKHLTFEQYIRDAEEAGVIDDLLGN